LSTLESLFSSPAALPVVPKVVAQLIASFRRDDITVTEIGALLAADPVLSAKTLRLANSAYFHVSRQIATVDDALRMLGFVMVRNLVVSCGVAGAFGRVPGLDMPQFWHHSLHTAAAARWLAQQLDLNAELAFIVGLTHGLGHLVMHAVQPAELQALDRQCHVLEGERAALERARFGYHHGEVSAELARRWKFPPEVTEPLQAVALPLEVKAAQPLARLVHIAAWRARVDSLGWDAAQAQASCPVAVGLAVGLDIAWLSDQATLAIGPAGPMPPLAELCNGMEAILD
jgi:putative nucleotidyltransferase with HDIG domain